jgi:uncharacterized protein YjbJ (UPF0337 family)
VEIVSGRIQRLWAESLDDQTGAVKGNLREIAGLIQRGFGLATEQAEKAVNRWQKEHQPIATLHAQGDRFNALMADHWATAKAHIDDARVDLADRREAVEADIDLLISRLQTRFNATPWADFNWRNRVYGNPLDGLGYNVVADDGLRAGAQLRPHYSGQSAIEGLDLPDLGADMAVYAFVGIPGNISVGGRVMRDISSQTEGTTYYASASHQRLTRIGLLQSTLYERGGDARSNDAYFGVDADAASVTGLTPYAPGSGVRNVGVAFLMLTPIGDHWAVATFANAERAMGDVADSPLIQARDEQGGF